MKVAISYTVEVDAEAWAEAYGLEPDEVRGDVKYTLADVGADWIQRLGFAPEEQA